MVQRVDPDYNPSEDEIESIARFVAHAARNPLSPILYKTGNGNGFQKWVLSITAGVAVVGIGGGVVMYGKLTALEQQNMDQSRELADLKREVADVKRLVIENRPRR